MYEDEDLSQETLLEEYQDENYWYKLYASGLLLQGGKAHTSNGEVKISMYKPYASTDYSIEIKNTTKETKYLPYKHKKVQVLDAVDDFSEYICPVNKTAFTYGIPQPKITSFKGPNKTANVELVTVDNEVGTSSGGSVEEITLNLAVNQFIQLKVDVQGARINNLPQGFNFANDTISGASKSAGTFKFNIVTENTSVPVIFNVSNVIRIT